MQVQHCLLGRVLWVAQFGVGTLRTMHASGGRALPADSLRPLVDRLAADLPDDESRGISPWLLFALLLAAAVAEWALRRLRGRP